MSRLKLPTLGTLMLAACLAGFLAPAHAKDKLSKAEKRWLEQEVAALITEKEVALFKDLSRKDRTLFQELFWARRDPNPMSPENEFRQDFEARMTTADRQFTSGRRKGSTTDMGKIFALLGAPKKSDRSQGGSSGGSSPSGTSTGPTSPVTDPDGEEASSRSLEIGSSASGRQSMTWTYDPNPFLGIPDGLIVEFRAHAGFGFRLVKSDEIEETLERVKNRYISNPGVSYARDEEGRLLKPAGPLDPNSPAKQILRDLQGSQATSNNVPFEPQLAFFRASEGQVYIPLLFKMKTEGFSWNGGKVHATVFGLIESADGLVVYQFEEPTTLTKSEDSLTSFDVPLQLPPGEYTLYLGVRDDKSARVGTRIESLEVPDYNREGPLLSTTLLYREGRRVEEPAGTPGHAFQFGQVQFVPKTVYKKTDTLGLISFVYGFGVDEQSGKPNLTSQYIFFREGRKRGQTKDEPIQAMESRAASTAEIPLSGFEPGGYKVRIKVTDHVKNKVVTDDIPFRLEGPSERQ